MLGSFGVQLCDALGFGAQTGIGGNPLGVQPVGLSNLLGVGLYPVALGIQLRFLRVLSTGRQIEREQSTYVSMGTGRC